MEADEILKKARNLLDYADKTRDVLKLQFDHFKNLTVLGSTALVLSFGLHNLVLSHFLFWQKSLFFLSLLLFLAVIVLSLSAMANAGNIITYCNELHVSVKSIDAKGTTKAGDNINAAFKKSKFLDNTTRYFYISGIAIIVFLTGVMIFSK